MINYKLAKEIGASHHIDHLLYKFNDDGFVMCYFTEYGWEKTENDAAHMAELNKIKFDKPKPRTRTEYEKVTESIFDLRDEFERGGLYGDNTGVTKIETLAHLGACCQAGNVFRKVEKEIDWREDADSYFLKTKRLGIDCTIEEAITRSDYCDEFLELCRVALRANGEIE